MAKCNANQLGCEHGIQPVKILAQEVTMHLCYILCVRGKRSSDHVEFDLFQRESASLLAHGVKHEVIAHHVQTDVQRMIFAFRSVHLAAYRKQWATNGIDLASYIQH